MNDNKPFGPHHYSQREINGVKAFFFIAAVLLGIAVAVGLIVIFYKRS